MIEKIRAYSATWWFRTFLGMIAVTFAILWGGGDWAHNMGSGHTQVVATVGGERITAGTLYQAVDRRLKQYTLSTGQRISEEEALKSGVFQDVLRSLIDEKLMTKEATRLGVTLTDAGVREAIIQNKLFLNDKGAFDKKRFEMIIERLGFNEASFVEETRKELIRFNMLRALFDGVKLPSLSTVTLYRWQGQTRQIVYTVIKSRDLPFKEVPTDADLKQMLTTYKKDLRAPEYRDFSAIILDPAKVNVTLTPGEVAKSYEDRKASFEGKSFESVKADIQKELTHHKALEVIYELAPKIEDAVGSGMTLQEVAEKFKLPLETFHKLDISADGDPFASEARKKLTPLQQAFVREAFSLEPQMAGSVVEGPDHVSFIVHVDKVQEAHDRTLAEIPATRAKDLWVAFKKKEKALSLAQDLSGSLRTPDAFKAAFFKNKWKVQTMRLTRQGPALGARTPLSSQAVERLFASPIGQGVAMPVMSTLEDTDLFLGCVESIADPDVASSEKGALEKADAFNKLYENDFVASYVFSLRKRYPVEINQKWFKSLQK